MAGIVANRLYHDPNLGAAFTSLAQAFGPPSAQDVAAYSVAGLNKQKNDQLAQLFVDGKSPSERAALIGVQNYGQTPEGFNYQIDTQAGTDRYGFDTQAATSRANNSADNQRATVTSMFAPLGEGEIRPAVPIEIAGSVGLPALPEVQGAPKLTDGARNYDFARGNGYAGSFEEWLEGEGGTEYGLNPVFGSDPSGNTVVMQLGKDGTAVATQLPDGISPDLGVRSFEAARGNEMGKQTGEATVGLNATLAKAEETLALIDSIAGVPGDPTSSPDPALAGITGLLQGRLPPLTQRGADLNAKIDQLKGRAFLEAFESLKGAGHITEVEGQKATDAIARLQRTQSEEGFLEALADLRGVVAAGMGRARARAGSAPQTTQPAPSPAPAESAPVAVQTVEEALRLPSGTRVIRPDGQIFEVP